MEKRIVGATVADVGKKRFIYVKVPKDMRHRFDFFDKEIHVTWDAHGGYFVLPSSPLAAAAVERAFCDVEMVSCERFKDLAARLTEWHRNFLPHFAPSGAWLSQWDGPGKTAKGTAIDRGEDWKRPPVPWGGQILDVALLRRKRRRAITRGKKLPDCS